LDTKTAVAALVKKVPNPKKGLPDEIFYYISRTTPLVNVDLLVKDEKGRTLLSWRDDRHAGKGWHIPGGIVRFKETLEQRLREVARTEIGTKIAFDPAPIAIHQLIHRGRAVRSHFISFLYECSLPGTFDPPNRGLSPRRRGYMKWHDHCPRNLIRYHEIYRRLIDRKPDRKNTI
jgi:colanic acid biosynthesis protein WcaH